MPRYLLPCRVLTQLALRRFLGRAIFGPFAERIAQRNDYRDKLKHEQNYKRSDLPSGASGCCQGVMPISICREASAAQTVRKQRPLQKLPFSAKVRL